MSVDTSTPIYLHLCLVPYRYSPLFVRPARLRYIHVDVFADVFRIDAMTVYSDTDLGRKGAITIGRK